MDFLDPNHIILVVLQFILGLAIVIIPVTATFGSGVYILRPLDRAARKRKMKVRFTIVDALALVTHLSIPLGFVGQISRQSGNRGAAYTLAVFGCFAAVLIWCGTVVTAARAGITQPAKRLMMIGLVVPLTFVVTIVFGPLLGYLLYHVLEWTASTFWLYLLALALGFGVFACRRAVDWILKTRPDRDEVVLESDAAFS